MIDKQYKFIPEFCQFCLVSVFTLSTKFLSTTPGPQSRPPDACLESDTASDRLKTYA